MFPKSQLEKPIIAQSQAYSILFSLLFFSFLFSSLLVALLWRLVFTHFRLSSERLLLLLISQNFFKCKNKSHNFAIARANGNLAGCAETIKTNEKWNKAKNSKSHECKWLPRARLPKRPKRSCSIYLLDTYRSDADRPNFSFDPCAPIITMSLSLSNAISDHQYKNIFTHTNTMAEIYCDCMGRFTRSSLLFLHFSQTHRISGSRVSGLYRSVGESKLQQIYVY